ncbi:MAG: carboxypeptidase regulatory-like domain-containing protein [Bacteroidales bacterium]
MWRLLRYACLALALVLSSAVIVGAQSTASISGVVRDSAGGVVPGATVVVKDENTGNKFEAVTGADGSYHVTALQAGTYTVAASLPGFKTAEAKGIRVAIGQPVSLNLALDVGKLEETVTVISSTELVNTQTATVAATLNSDQLNRMPTPTRNALNAITFLPGVNTPGTNRDSTINGLPETFLSITLDGVSNNDNFLRTSDGFFASVTPRQDAVEAASVTLAAAGASVGGGQGAITMAFQTRSGGNRFAGSVYEYWRDPRLNTNYYFNEIAKQPKNDVKLNQYGGRAGGPIYIPGLYDGRNKAFFFFHYEQLRFPNSFTRTRTVLNARAVDGIFRWECATGVTCEKNVLDLAAANKQITATDPTVMTLLHDIDKAMTTTGTRSATTDPLLDQYVWLSPGKLFEHQPTMRLDFNLTNNHRLSGSFSFITASRDPDYLNAIDARFPGAPNYRLFESTRPLMSLSLRSTLSRNVINELKGGLTAFYGYSHFGKNLEGPEGADLFSDTNGYAIDFDQNIGLTNWFATNAPSWRSAPTYSVDDNVTWQKNKHAITFGGSFLISTAGEYAKQVVPGINLGFNSQYDPARTMFTNANFLAGQPAGAGITSANLNDARDLYALLTGRVYSVTGQAALEPDTNKYTEFGTRLYAGSIMVFGGYLQDSWKLSPALTLTGGLRYDVQTPFKASNSTMSSVTLESICGMSGLGDGSLYNKCNFLDPGSSGGAVPEFIQLKQGTEGYKTDWNNVAPSFSVAWRPSVREGWLRKFLGDPEQATLRGGLSTAYERHGMQDWTSTYGANQGATISLNRGADTGLVPAGQSWPVLLSQPDRLYQQSFSENPSYPIALRPARQDEIDGFAPDIQIGRSLNWTVGFQRSITSDMALEIRYLGTRGTNQWSQNNWNGIRGENLVANKFMDEFKLAMANLVANNTAGGNRAGSFAYFGPGTGTNPLPTYLAYFNGSKDYNNAAAYTGGSNTWSNTTFVGRLAPSNPNPTSAAGDLDGNQGRRQLAASAGYPANFFVLNPAASGVYVFDSGAFSDYQALQFEVRRRFSHGFSANVNYQYGIEAGSAFDGFSFGRTMVTGGGVRHAIKGQWDWTIPVGREQRYGANMHPVLNAILGGWSTNGVLRTQARVVDFGNVRLVGMTPSDLQKMYKYYFTTNATSGLTEVYMLPEDVRLNTRRAFSTSTTSATGYSTSLGPPAPGSQYIAPANSQDCVQVRAGDCAPRTLLIRTPWFFRVDIGATKRFPIQGSMNIEVAFQMLNLFDNVNFNPVANPGSASSIFQVTSGYTDPSNTYDPGGRLGQIMIRFNW